MYVHLMCGLLVCTVESTSCTGLLVCTVESTSCTTNFTNTPLHHSHSSIESCNILLCGMVVKGEIAYHSDASSVC